MKAYSEMSQSEKLEAMERHFALSESIKSLLTSTNEDTDESTASAVADLLVKQIDENSGDEEDDSLKDTISDFLELVAETSRELRG